MSLLTECAFSTQISHAIYCMVVDRLNCNITIKLDNYRKYFNSNNEFTFCLAYIHLMKRDENSKDDCLLRLFKDNN